jgi:putative DNA-invertase from lambdoid prophage Rac
MSDRKLTAAIYVRVSTVDQKLDMQTTEVRQYAERMGWTVAEYSDKMSGSKARRPGLDRLMDDARLRKIDIVLVWKMDRFGRSLKDLISNILLLDGYGVRFVSVTQGIDTDKQNPASRFMMHILAAVAEFERGIISERVNSGVKQYMADYAAGKIGKTRHSKSGKNLAHGRPRRIFRRDEMVKLRKAGHSLRAIAKQLGLPLSTVVDALKGK